MMNPPLCRCCGAASIPEEKRIVVGYGKKHWTGAGIYYPPIMGTVTDWFCPTCPPDLLSYLMYLRALWRDNEGAIILGLFLGVPFLAGVVSLFFIS